MEDASNQVDGQGVYHEKSEKSEKKMLKSKMITQIRDMETGNGKVCELPYLYSDAYVNKKKCIWLTQEQPKRSRSELSFNEADLLNCDMVDPETHTTSPFYYEMSPPQSKVENSSGKEALNDSEDLMRPDNAAQSKATKPIVQSKTEDTRRIHVNKKQNRNKRIKIDGTKKKPSKRPLDIGFWKWLQMMISFFSLTSAREKKIGFWKLLQMMISFFPSTSARKKKIGFWEQLSMICLIYLIFLCRNTSAGGGEKCELENRSIKMDKYCSTLTFHVCFNESLCQETSFRWDKDLKQLYLNDSNEKNGLKYDFHQDLESGCVEMVIKNVNNEDLKAHYKFSYSFRNAEFEPRKQPIIVGEPAIVCVNGSLELRSKIKPGLPEKDIKLWTFVEKDGQKQVTHDIIDMQDGNISLPINESFVPYNISVEYYYNEQKYVLFKHHIGTKKMEKCKAVETRMQSESNKTGVVIGIVCAVLTALGALLVIFLCWWNRVQCFRGRTGNCELPCKDPSEDEEETGESML